MHVAATNDFAADPTTVFAMLTDPQFQAAVAADIEALDHGLTVTGNRVENLRVVPTPESAAKFAGPKLEIVEVIDWSEPTADGARTGDLDVSVTGKPATWRGTAALAPGGRGTTVTYDGEFKVNIPIVGKLLEKQASEALSAIVRVQQRVGDKRLG